jgi:uncharacterized membrane protein YsdA (DUF1294 family)
VQRTRFVKVVADASPCIGHHVINKGAKVMSMNPVYRYGLVTFGLTIVLAAVLWLGVRLDVVLSWLMAITLVTFLTYGYDKAIAGSERTRVPEKVLLALALAGGTIGALVGMRIFRHKTAKGSFRAKFGLVIIAQILVLVVYYVLIKPLPF